MKQISDELINQIIILLNKPDGVTSLEKAGIIQRLQSLENIENNAKKSNEKKPFEENQNTR